MLNIISKMFIVHWLSLFKHEYIIIMSIMAKFASIRMLLIKLSRSKEMKNKLILLFPVFAVGSLFSQNRLPIMERVNIQSDSAKVNQIVDGKWVCVGIKKDYAIQYDYDLMFEGRPSYRFELKKEDNTLSGYAKGETKGRAEMSYCYAVSSDFDSEAPDTYSNASRMKTVYHHGKGFCKQGSAMRYRFSVYVPENIDDDVSTIFAQWHGMPSRTLVSNPSGEVILLSDDEFLKMEEHMIFKKNVAYDKIEAKDGNGKTVYRRSKEPNGWLVEQGGYPPMAFGFSDGYFYIKANSDAGWLTDKDVRCNVSPAKCDVMEPRRKGFKACTIAYKIPIGDFPKCCWVTFDIFVKWSEYRHGYNEMLSPGMLDVYMGYNGKKHHIVDNKTIEIGRNDMEGYYFKFGIYRVGNSDIPVCYNLSGYSEEVIK